MPSSVIRAMRFDPVRSVLEIAFRGARGAYRYFGVPAEVWRKFRDAPSKGEYLNAFFKSHQYTYEKLTGPLGVSKRPITRPTPDANTETLQWGEPIAFPSVPSHPAPQPDPAIKIRARAVPVQEQMFFKDAA